MESVFFYPLTLHNGDNVGETTATWVSRLPLLQGSANQVVVLVGNEGQQLQGMYAWDGRTWRFVLPYQRVATAIINGDVLDVYYSVDVQSTPVTGSEIWRNGLLTNSTTINPGGGAAWATLRLPPAGSGTVKSVNGILPDAGGDVELPASAGGVTSVISATVGSGLTLIKDDGSASHTAVVKQLVPGTNVTLTATGDGITINAAATPYTLPAASPTVLGGVKAGSGVTIAGDGTLSVPSYTLPVANASVLGGVKAGANVTIAGDGTISVAAPAASGITQVTVSGGGISLINNDGTVGGVAKVKTLLGGHNINYADDGNTITIHADVPGYSLPTASASVLGGIKIGSGLTIDGSGVVSATGGGTGTGLSKVQSEGTGVSLVDNDGTTGGVAILKSLAAGDGVTITPAGDGKTLTLTAVSSYTLPVATNTVLGGVKQGAGISIAGDGTISTSYALPTASASVLGGIKIGAGLSIDGAGVVSASGAVASVNTKTGAIVIAGSDYINVDSSGANIVLSLVGAIADAPNDGTMYARQNAAWTAVPDIGSAIISVTGQVGTGAVLLVTANPPAHSAIIKSLVAGNNIALNEVNGLITVSASIPAGTVATVNTKAPDVNGNVAITAADTAALALTGGTMQGAVNMASFKITGLPAPTVAGDAVPLSYLSGLTIDGGTYA